MQLPFKFACILHYLYSFDNLFFFLTDASSDLCCFVLSRAHSKKINVDNYSVLLRFAFFTKQDTPYADAFEDGMDIFVNYITFPLYVPVSSR